ncbi:hypothetical protein [Neptuniibacter sp. QD37_11]|uniref:hypothetical protein n=1 Tax=Neptuniibacter sp. QD37_11 TaxID=3398209 RepID=UPI0039F5816E
MSVSLLGPEHVDQVVTSLIKYYDENFGSEDPSKNKLSCLIHDLFTAASREEGVMSPENLRDDLLKQITSENIAVFQENYSNRYPEEVAEVQAEIEAYSDEAEPLPMVGLKNLIDMQSAIYHVAYNLDRATPVGKAMNVIDDQMAGYVLKQVPGYPSKTGPVDQVAADLISLRTWGDKLYHYHCPIDSVLVKFEMSTVDDVYDEDVIYGENYLATLYEQAMSEERPIVLPTEQGHSNNQLPGLRTLAGDRLGTIRIQADVPKPEFGQVMHVARALDDLKAKVDAMPLEDFCSTQGEPLSQEQLDSLKGRLDSAVNVHNSMAFGGLIHLQRQRDRSQEVENDGLAP